MGPAESGFLRPVRPVAPAVALSNGKGGVLCPHDKPPPVEEPANAPRCRLAADSICAFKQVAELRGEAFSDIMAKGFMCNMLSPEHRCA